VCCLQLSEQGVGLGVEGPKVDRPRHRPVRAS
jgi:hypothetical protein